MMPRKWIVAGSVLAAGMLAQVPVLAQRVDQTRIIDLHVNAEQENRSFQGSVLEGTGFRVTFHGVGTYEIVPVIVNEAQGTFRVTVYRGLDNSEAAELRAVETVTARQGVPVALHSMPAVGLVVEGVRRAAPQAAAGTQSVFFTAIATTRIESAFSACCVRCGNVTACGCKVVHDCDSCCEGACCPPPIETSNDRVLPRERSFARLAGQCGNPIRNEERIHTGASRSATVVVSR